jgi:hypothetical protein
VTTQHQLALLRIAAQRIVDPDFGDAADAVAWLTAVQGQDRTGAVTAIALRTASADRAGVEAAFTAGRIVRSWPMRGTLHVVAAADLGWLLDLTAARMIAATAARRLEIGLDDETLALARTSIVAALTGNAAKSRAEVMSVLDTAGIPSGRIGYSVLFHLAQQRILCFGPVRDGEQLIVLNDDWIRQPRSLERDEALGELALRYFRGHGPATVKDFSRWINLVAADVKIGLALARPALSSIDVDGIGYLMDPQTPDRLEERLAEARGVFLLPGFDEYVLGYSDRRAYLPPEFAHLIVPGGNGVFRPTVLSDGRIVGTWAYSGRAANRAIAAVPFTKFTRKVEAGIAKAYRALP